MVGYAGSGDPTDAYQYAGDGTLADASRELFKVVPEVTIEHLVLVVLTVFITFFGLFSGFIKERLYVGEAIIATVFGICFSGYAAGIFAPRTWAEGHHFDEITLEVTRVVIALSVFAVGVELPKAYILRHWRSLSILLGPVMLFGWMISGALMYAIIPGLDFLPALVVAAGVTPTDPILASSVVGKGKFAQEHVPAHIRHLLQAESGSNDGAAFPFLYLALFLLMREDHSIGSTIGYWILLVILYQIILGIIIGTVVGIFARKLLKFSKRRELIDRESMVAMYVALALLVTGLTTLAGSDDLLAAFACGTAFAWDDWFTESIEESNFSSTIDLLANCAMFIYLGATMPFDAWNNATLTLTPWRLVVLAISILCLRRLPTIFALQWWIPDIKTRREALFAGHFGPMGVGAIFISTLAASKLPTPNVPPQNRIDLLALTIQPITYFIVLSSILIHGLTISFFSLGRRVHSRVTSISRTFTAASGTNDEPSWMSRVKRARNPQDIIVNRDDDDEPPGDVVDLAEKGEGTGVAASGDTGILAMFGAPRTLGGEGSRSTPASSSAGTEVGSGSKSEKELDEGKSEQELDEGDKRTEHERENDEHPPENVLGGNEEELEVKRRESVHEQARVRRGSTPPRDEEGRTIIISDHNDPDRIEVIDSNPTPEKIESAESHPHKNVIHIPSNAIDAELARLKKESFTSPELREENAVKKAVLRRGSIAAATQAAATQAKAAVALMKPKDDGLTQAQREEKQRLKLEKDAWCRREKHYPSKKPVGPRREWIEGDKVVVEGDNEEEATVREMTQKEKDQKAAKHVLALKKLGHPLSAVESEFAKLGKSISRDSAEKPSSGAKGKGKAAAPLPSPGPSFSDEPGSYTDHLPPPSKAPAAKPAAIVEDNEDDDEEVERPRPPPNKSLGLSLTKTIRPGSSDDEDEDDVESPAPDPAPVMPKRPAAALRRPTPPLRKDSLAGAMRQLFKRADARSPGLEDRRHTFDEPPPEDDSGPSIRFTTPNRPSRDGGVSTGRPLPVVGAGLSVRRVPTQPKSS